MKRLYLILFLVLGLSLFLLPLLNAWHFYPWPFINSQTSYAALAGLLPWSDANGYYTGANTLLETGLLDAWNSRRPLNAILFSLRLWVGNFDFKLALLFQALLCGLSCLLVTSVLAKRFGKISAILTLFILFIFSAVFIPTTLSETLGITLGGFAFVLLWDGNLSKRLLPIAAGSCLLTIALNARAGAFFTLPLLVIWFGWMREKKDFIVKHRLSYSLALSLILGVALGFSVNLVIGKLYADPSAAGIMHANLSHTLYGIAAGGKGWSYAYDVLSLPGGDAENARFMYSEAWKLFCSKPWLTVLGLKKSFVCLFKDTIIFFVAPPISLTGKLLVASLGILLLAAFIKRLRVLYPRYPISLGFLIAVFLGGVFSAAIIWIDGRYRVFAVTVPFYAAFIGIVYGSFFSKNLLEKSESSAYVSSSLIWERNTAYILGFGLVIAAILGPHWISHTFNSQHKLQELQIIQNFSCSAADETPFVIRNIAVSPQIGLNPPAEEYKRKISESTIEDKEGFIELASPKILNTEMILGKVYDLQKRTDAFILGKPEIFKARHGLIGVCGKPIKKLTSEHIIFKVNSYEVLDAS